MRIENLTPRQLAKLQEAKAEVMRVGFLNRECTDQQFLNAVSVHRRTRKLLGMLSDAMKASPRIKSMNKAMEVFAEAAENLWDEVGVWDADGWHSS